MTTPKSELRQIKAQLTATEDPAERARTDRVMRDLDRFAALHGDGPHDLDAPAEPDGHDPHSTTGWLNDISAAAMTHSERKESP